MISNPSEAATSSAQPWPIAVFAHNEEAHIAECLDSLYSAASGKAFKCFVLVNGCTDETEQRVREYSANHPEVTLVSIAMGDKSNAWNVYVHEYAPRDSDVHFFIDGDVNAMPNSLVALYDALTANTNANAAAALPVSGRNKEKIRRGIIEQRDLPGNLYALSGCFVSSAIKNGVRLPIGLIGDDSIVCALAKWNLEPRGPWEQERVTFSEGAGFSFESLSWRRPDNWRLYWRRRIRYSFRGFQNQLLGPVLTKEGVGGMPWDVTELYQRYGHACRLRWKGVDTLFDWIALRRIRRIAECTK